MYLKAFFLVSSSIYRIICASYYLVFMKHFFPIFEAQPDLVYLNNAATTHKPISVLNAMGEYLSSHYDTYGRTEGVGADSAYDRYSRARETIATWIEAVSPMEIVPCQSSTHASNLITQTLVYNDIITTDDVVLVSVSEHHSVLVPILQMAKKVGFEVRYVHVDTEGLIDCLLYTSDAADD